MKKIISAGVVDPREIHEKLKKGYGLEHPERVNGYRGFFVSYGNVYVSDDVAVRMEHSKEFSDFVYQSFRDFQNDSYGMIANFDHDENVECKWLGGAAPVLGRYPYGPLRNLHGYAMPETFIKIRSHGDNTYIMFDAELDSVCIK